MKNISIITGIFLLSLSIQSCSDWLDIKPLDSTVLEDYWKTGNDVESVVLTCYKSMIENDFMDRVIASGELRSDNTVLGLNMPVAHKYLYEATVQPDNDLAKWECFYRTINYCNTVLKYAPEVPAIDPDYSQGLMRAHLAEALTLRALCYFYLIRIYGDVPLITEPYSDDSEEFRVPQSSEALILAQLVSDLLEAEKFAVLSRGGDTTDNIRQNKGRVTKHMVRALLADIYLWQGNYSSCIEMCDKVLNFIIDPDKVEDPDLLTGAELYLIPNSKTVGYNSFNTIFSYGNSAESIFELQFDNLNRNNKVLDYYGTSSRVGYLATAAQASQTWFPTTDLRGKSYFIVDSGSDEDGYTQIFKGRGSVFISSTTSVTYSFYSTGTSANWVVYRLPDVMLMKAEALNEQGSEEDMKAALELVNEVYMRSNPDQQQPLQYADYGAQYLMRNLILLERQREFMFEGKRWFDLLRQVRRDGSPADILNSYISVKYSMNFQIVSAKLNNLGAWYMPIHEAEITANTTLVQNDFYKANFSSK